MPCHSGVVDKEAIRSLHHPIFRTLEFAWKEIRHSCVIFLEMVLLVNLSKVEHCTMYVFFYAIVVSNIFLGNGAEHAHQAKKKIDRLTIAMQTTKHSTCSFGIIIISSKLCFLEVFIPEWSSWRLLLHSAWCTLCHICESTINPKYSVADHPVGVLWGCEARRPLSRHPAR